jgi:uncharacterized protein
MIDPGTLAPDAAAALSLLILQPTPFCNIDCTYCYLSHRTSRARMSLETLDLVCDRVFGGAVLGSHLDVAWHAGEPLTVPLAWYAQAFATIERRRPPGLDIRHCFQTNGLLLDRTWARFLADAGARVGISLDGSADLHDRHRRTRSGRGTHAGAMRAVALMQEEGHPFHVITVLTERSLDDPDRLFDFYVENGIVEVGFNIDEIEGRHGESSHAGNGAEARFRKFLARFLERVFEEPGLISVREIEDALGFMLAGAPVVDQQNVPFSILSVSHDGNVSTFSPELLDARHRRYDGFTLGNVATHSLADLAAEPRFQALDRAIQEGVGACRRECPHFRWCGGGAPANKLFETGGFEATETLHCRLTRKAVFDVVLEGLEARMGTSDADTTDFYPPSPLPEAKTIGSVP